MNEKDNDAYSVELHHGWRTRAWRLLSTTSNAGNRLNRDCTDNQYGTEAPAHDNGPFGEASIRRYVHANSGHGCKYFRSCRDGAIY